MTRPAPVSQPLVTLWIKGLLNRLTVACLKSAIRVGHEVHLYSYHDVPNIPAGVRHLDAREVVPEDEIFQYDGVENPAMLGSYAPFSDAFRYRTQSQARGIWFDSDVYFLRRLGLHGPVLLGWEGPRPESETRDPFAHLVGNAIMLIPPSSPVVSDLVRLTSRPYEMPPWVPAGIRARAYEKLQGRPFFPGAVTYATFGPVAVNHFVHKHGLTGSVSAHLRYYPVGYREIRRFGEPDTTFRASLGPETECIHIWNSNFSRAFAAGPPKGSFAARLQEESLDA
jgi:hypothetical protein